MKKNIGNYNACFPMPIVVVGAMVNGKPSWFEVAWTGIGERDIITLSVDPDHYTCDGIFNHSKLSVSLVNETSTISGRAFGLIPRSYLFRHSFSDST